MAVPANDHGSRLPLVDQHPHHNPHAPSTDPPSSQEEIGVPAAIGCRPTLPHAVPGAPPLHTPAPLVPPLLLPLPLRPALPQSVPGTQAAKVCHQYRNWSRASNSRERLQVLSWESRPDATRPQCLLRPGWHGEAGLSAAPHRRDPPAPQPRPSRAPAMAKATSGAAGLGLKLVLLLPLLGEGESHGGRDRKGRGEVSAARRAWKLTRAEARLHWLAPAACAAGRPTGLGTG